MEIDEALERVMNEEKEVILLIAENEKNRNVMKTTAYRLRQKMEKSFGFEKVKKIGISLKEVGGNYFLKIFYKRGFGAFEIKDGMIVEITEEKELSAGVRRQLDVMVADKMEKEKIVEIVVRDFAVNEVDVKKYISKIALKTEASEVKLPEESENVYSDENDRPNADKLHRLEEKKAMMDLGED